MLKLQKLEIVDLYLKQLSQVASLSNFFSESEIPFLHYRAAENIFCNVFNAQNTSRNDIAYDAVVNKIGIGIKTFIITGLSKLEKVAEFNVNASALRNLKGESKLHHLVKLRNERILFADRVYDIQSRLYHCIARRKGELVIFEDSYNLIDLETVKIVSDTDSKFSFKDKFSEYSYNISKSTLYRRFSFPKSILKQEVNILLNPLSIFDKTLPNLRGSTIVGVNKKVISSVNPTENKIKENNYVILPLYSPLYKSQGKEPVPEKCQLNQWNAGGRKRDAGEVYITIPTMVHTIKPNFFPKRNESFNLVLPTGEILKAKVCQAQDKALMTNPNNALSDWLLRKTLKVKPNTLVKYNKLETIGVDSVRIEKTATNNYKINFTPLGSYEEFIDDL